MLRREIKICGIPAIIALSVSGAAGYFINRSKSLSLRSMLTLVMTK